jgi:hypothetical protein
MQDFSAMAQGAPAQEPQEIDMKQLKEGMPNEQDFEKLGLPTGDDKESIKARLLKMLEDADALEALETPADKQEFAQNLDALAQAIVDKDLQAIQSNPINGLLEQIFGGAQGQQMPQQAAPQQAAPKDFASMMPPTPGGGLGGL